MTLQLELERMPLLSLGNEDASGALEGSEELEIARLQREIANSVQSNPEIVVELMRTWLGSED